MYDEKVEAYAVITDQKIDIRTVSDTRRAAIVNWLVVSPGFLVWRTHTDEEIENLWKQFQGDAIVATVEISRVIPPIIKRGA